MKALDTGIKQRSSFSGVVVAGAQSGLSRVTAHVSRTCSGGGDRSDLTEVLAQPAAAAVLREAWGTCRPKAQAWASPGRLRRLPAPWGWCVNTVSPVRDAWE